jgi:hypothetical protein
MLPPTGFCAAAEAVDDLSARRVIPAPASARQNDTIAMRRMARLTEGLEKLRFINDDPSFSIMIT